MKIRCVCKNRNNRGDILTYTLQDENGRIFLAKASDIKREIRLKKHQFVNLQIDKAGRLVDKAEHIEPMNTKMTAEFEKTFIQKLMQDKDVLSIVDAMARELARCNYTDIFKFNLGSSIFACAGESSDTNDRLVEKMIQNNTVDQFMVVMPYVFEQCLAKRGVEAPYKLHIKSKNEVFDYIEYRNSLCDIKYDINADIGYSKYDQATQNDPVRRCLGKNPYYFNPNNYIIKLHKLGCENNPVRIYAAADMSLVCPAQNAPQQMRNNMSVKQNQQEARLSNKDTLGLIERIGKLFRFK